MIFTRFGSEVEVLGGNIEKGEIDINIFNEADGLKLDKQFMSTYINELKADNGFTEICEAINKANIMNKLSKAQKEVLESISKGMILRMYDSPMQFNRYQLLTVKDGKASYVKTINTLTIEKLTKLGLIIRGKENLTTSMYHSNYDYHLAKIG